MNALATLRCWWKTIVHRTRTNDEIEAEARFLIEEYSNDLMRGGVSAEDARRQATANFGRADTQKEKYREAIGLRLFDEIGGDIRYGLHLVLRDPGFASIAILSLAIGIGATTAMFSLIHAVLLHPFPYAGSLPRPRRRAYSAVHRPMPRRLSRRESMSSSRSLSSFPGSRCPVVAI